MKRRTFIGSAAAAGVTLAATERGFAQSDAGTATPATGGADMQGAAESGYAPVNGLQMYYEIHGTGEPLVLLHGAYGTIDQWGDILTTLAAHHQVIALETQAHGHTADIDRPIRYETMADDVDLLMEHIGIDQADIVGYSMGAGTAFRLAIQHPERVRKLVAVSSSISTEGAYAEIWEGIAQITPEMFAGSPYEDAYLRNSPEPEGFPNLVEKLKDLDMQEFTWPDEEISGITAPTLLIIGDSDIVTPEHIVEVFKLLGGGVPGDLTGLPNSQLAIIPGSTHVGIGLDRARFWLPMVEDFLAAPMPEAG
jgi:pimeloyl-ACP methyl ester carboxylesterase